MVHKHHQTHQPLTLMKRNESGNTQDALPTCLTRAWTTSSTPYQEVHDETEWRGGSPLGLALRLQGSQRDRTKRSMNEYLCSVVIRTVLGRAAFWEKKLLG